MNAEILECTERACEAVALNDEQSRLIFDPTVVDSLATRIVALRNDGVEESTVKVLLADLRRLLELNSLERDEELQLAGALDGLLRAQAVTSELTIKGIARRLRPLLAAVEHPLHEIAASHELRRVVRALPANRLRAQSLRNELGGRRHARVLELIEAA